MARRRAVLVHQGIWNMPLLSTPLGPGYLKAAALSDDVVRSEFDIEIENFRGGVTETGLASALFAEGPPDVLAFSAFGWNYKRFGAIAETYKQLRPDGWVVFGGVHVTEQAERVFRMYPAADVVVNGEGEWTFRDLLRGYLAGKRVHELGDIPGLSVRLPDGLLFTSSARGRIMDLDEIPSPFLTGAIPMSGAKGDFLYDVGLMETNRGCPYSCSFCFWGGATGQKVRCFSRDRLREELELFARLKVTDLFLCDANFGMLPSDATFVEDFIKVREKYGYPRRLEPSWAKNKSKTFYGIVERMTEVGLRTSFTMALQSLDGETLRLSKRSNMKLNEWGDLVDWLVKQGLDCYAELIWGLPGETFQSFLDGYDRLAERFSRIATYSVIVIPNTELADQAQEFGLVMVRGGSDDFGHVLSHRTMTLDENRRMHRFLFWARTLAEHMYFRHIWAPLRKLAGFRQSEVLLGLDDWMERRTDPTSTLLKECREKVVDHLDTGHISDGLRALYSDEGVQSFFEAWWRECVVPRLPAHLVSFFEDLFRYDWETRPVYETAGDLGGRSRTVVFGEDCFVSPELELNYDIPALSRKVRSHQPVEIVPAPRRLTLYFRSGFARNVDSHEVQAHYVGMTLEELSAEVRPSRGGSTKGIAPSAGISVDGGLSPLEAASAPAGGPPVAGPSAA